MCTPCCAAESQNTALFAPNAADGAVGNDVPAGEEAGSFSASAGAEAFGSRRAPPAASKEAGSFSASAGAEAFGSGRAPPAASKEVGPEAVEEEEELRDETAAAPSEPPAGEPPPEKEAAPLPGDQLLGEWTTPKGKYTIYRDHGGDVVFEETSSPPLELVGVLVQRGEWFEAEIVDRAKGNASYGFIKFQAHGGGVFSTFKRDAGMAWRAKGHLAKKA